MHVCQYYVKGSCKYGAGCRLVHDIYAEQPKAVLRRCGIDVQRPQQEVLDALRALLRLQNVVSSTGSVQTQRIEPVSGLLARNKGTSGRKAPGEEDKSPKLCVYHLRGHCNYGDSCTRLHSTQIVPYLWQWSLDGAAAAAAAGGGDSKTSPWNEFDVITSSMTERLYCDPDIKDSCYVIDSNSDSIDIDFDEMNFRRVKDGRTGRIRRLGTESVSSETHALRTFTTLWKWYWKAEDGKWKVYTDSDDIEQTFKTRKPLYLSDKMDFWIDFGALLQFNTRTDTDRYVDVRRRPALYVLRDAKQLTESAALKGAAAAPPAVTYPTSWTLSSGKISKFGSHSMSVWHFRSTIIWDL